MSGFEVREIAIARLLITSLRATGTRSLAMLPQAREDDTDPLAVLDKVVAVEGIVRDLLYEDGLLIGRIAVAARDDAWFVTPIATEGVAVDRRCIFRGVAIPVRDHAAGQPRAILIGAFGPS